MNPADIAAELGMAVHEIIDVAESPAGLIMQAADGNWKIKVPDDLTDADGKTGWMWLVAPNVAGGYRGTYPVFVNHLPDTSGPDGGAVVGDVDDLSTLDKEQLLAHARTLGVEVNSRWGPTRILQALADAAAAADTGADTTGDESDESDDDDAAADDADGDE